MLHSLSYVGRPKPPTNCSQYNHSSDAILISCLPGYDGGLEQLFTLELYAHDTDTLVRNLTLAYPSFVVTRLEAAAIFDARIYASNAKGRSEAAPVIRSSTLKRPSEKRLATTASPSLTLPIRRMSKRTLA